MAGPSVAGARSDARCPICCHPTRSHCCAVLRGWFGPFLCQADYGKQPAADQVEKDVHNINESFDKKEARETIVSSALFT